MAKHCETCSCTVDAPSRKASNRWSWAVIILFFGTLFLIGLSISVLHFIYNYQLAEYGVVRFSIFAAALTGGTISFLLAYCLLAGYNLLVLLEICFHYLRDITLDNIRDCFADNWFRRYVAQRRQARNARITARHDNEPEIFTEANLQSYPQRRQHILHQSQSPPPQRIVKAGAAYGASSPIFSDPMQAEGASQSENFLNSSMQEMRHEKKKSKVAIKQKYFKEQLNEIKILPLIELPHHDIPLSAQLSKPDQSTQETSFISNAPIEAETQKLESKVKCSPREQAGGSLVSDPVSTEKEGRASKVKRVPMKQEGRSSISDQARIEVGRQTGASNVINIPREQASTSSISDPVRIEVEGQTGACNVKYFPGEQSVKPRAKGYVPFTVVVSDSQLTSTQETETCASHESSTKSDEREVKNLTESSKGHSSLSSVEGAVGQDVSKDEIPRDFTFRGCTLV